MRDLAADFVEHFEFDFGEAGMTASLADTAPEGLLALAREVCPDGGPECLAQLFEALSAISDSEEDAVADGFQSEVDEKVCTLGFCDLVVDRLRTLADG